MAHLDIDAYSSTIGAFYDAAYGAARWPDALSKLNHLMSGSRSWLFHCEPGRLNAHMSVYDEGFHSAEGQAAAKRDPLFELYRTRQPRTMVRHSAIEDVRDFRKRELWQDWLRPRDMDFGLQCTLMKRGSDVFYLDMNRSLKQGDFTDNDLAKAGAVLPHILRAGEIAAIVEEQRGVGDAIAGPVAMIAVDANSRVLDLNAAAAAIFDHHSSTLGLSSGRIHATDPRTARHFQELVAGCARSNPLSGGVLVLRDGATPCLVASVAPLAPRTLFGFAREPRAAVFLRDVHGRAETALDSELVSLFRLQPAHARLAAVLSTGMSLRQAALERGISYTTARTYLDHIFRQTGTSRQPELVALLKTIEVSLTL